MPRIPQHELERLKRDVDLAELVRAHGVELKGTGDSLLGLCPFHDDRNPSLVVTRSKNLWACKGACSSGGSVVDWVMRTEGVGFRHAVEILRERHGTSPVSDGFDVGSGELASPLSLGAPDEALLAQVVDYYHATLKAVPEALAYLTKRGIEALPDREGAGGEVRRKSAGAIHGWPVPQVMVFGQSLLGKKFQLLQGGVLPGGP